MAVHGHYVLLGACKSGTCTLFKRAHTHSVLSLNNDARPSLPVKGERFERT